MPVNDPSRAGINSWWNQAAPGLNQMRIAGKMVETVASSGQIREEMSRLWADLPGSMYRKSALYAPGKAGKSDMS